MLNLKVVCFCTCTYNYEIAIQSYKNRDFSPKQVELGIALVNILYQIIVQFNSTARETIV